MAGEHGDLRDRLLRAAAELLDVEGLDAVTVRAVARRARVTHGAPRRHFPTRAHLLATVAQTGFVELSRRLDAVDAADAPGRLRHAAHSYVAFARERPALFDLMTRHDLLEGSGLDLRASSLAVAARWDGLVRSARPQASQRDSVLLFAAVHGVAALHSHRALELLGQEPAALIDVLLDG